MPFIFKSILKKTNSTDENNEMDLFISPNQISYTEEIQRLKERVSYAYDNLDNVVDPLLIDSWIYEINAAQLRYQFCLQQLKQPALDHLKTEKTGVV